jgi:hypothetical protein
MSNIEQISHNDVFHGNHLSFLFTFRCFLLKHHFTLVIYGSLDLSQKMGQCRKYLCHGSFIIIDPRPLCTQGSIDVITDWWKGEGQSLENNKLLQSKNQNSMFYRHSDI